MNISILGSTGSIGTQTLDIVRDHSDEFKVTAITGNKNVALLERQAREFKPELVCVADVASASELKIKLNDTNIKVLGGKESLVEASSIQSADTVVTAVVGMTGIEPTISAIKSTSHKLVTTVYTMRKCFFCHEAVNNCIIIS